MADPIKRYCLKLFFLPLFIIFFPLYKKIKFTVDRDQLGIYEKVLSRGNAQKWFWCFSPSSRWHYCSPWLSRYHSINLFIYGERKKQQQQLRSFKKAYAHMRQENCRQGFLFTFFSSRSSGKKNVRALHGNDFCALSLSHHIPFYVQQVHIHISILIVRLMRICERRGRQKKKILAIYAMSMFSFLSSRLGSSEKVKAIEKEIHNKCEESMESYFHLTGYC